MKATILENLLLALGTLASHKLRSALTILGVVIGTTCVIAIGSILTGMDRSIVGMVEQFGTNTIFVQKFNMGPRFGNLSREERMRKPISWADYEAVRDSCSACRLVALELELWRNFGARYKADKIDRVHFGGNTPDFAEAMNLNIGRGRYFTEADNQRRADVCVVGADIVKTFFPRGGGLDEEIMVEGHACRVIGIFAPLKAAVGESSQDLHFQIPYETFQKRYPFAKEHFMVIQAHRDRMSEAIDQVRQALRRSRRVSYKDPDNFGMATADSFIEQFHQITGAVAIVMVVISSIGLLVGGVGVMNIMLVSVTERTREIGVRKAIGARRIDIILQFLMEACTLTGAGGLMGILLGVLISLLIQLLLPSLPSVVPLWAVVIGFVVSVAVGIFFGMWPAVKAARLDPVEALRYE